MEFYKKVKDIPIGRIKKILDDDTFKELSQIAYDVSKFDHIDFECKRGFNRKLTYDPLILKKIQESKLELVEAIFQKKLKKSHTVLSCYYAGGNCYYHYDKPDHAYILNIAVNKNIDWPLMVEANFYNLDCNDALFFNGYIHKHGRHGVLGKNRFVHNAFIYYTDVDFV
jgi:hypothetical protein